jgi:hypothetical protein
MQEEQAQRLAQRLLEIIHQNLVTTRREHLEVDELVRTLVEAAIQNQTDPKD